MLAHKYICKHSEERNFVNSVHSLVNVESVKNVTFDFFVTSHSLSSHSTIQDVIVYSPVIPYLVLPLFKKM